MELTVGTKKYVFIDRILKKHVHEFAKTNDRREKGEIDDMDVSDEMLATVIESIDGNADKATFKAVLNELPFPEYEELVRTMNPILRPDEKKSENSSTSTKPSSTEEAETSLPNG